MNPKEIVVCVLDCQRSNMILNLLTESIGQPGEASITHANCKVLPFYVAGADVLRVWRTDQSILFASDANRWAVSLFAFRVGAVNLDDLSVVNFSAEGLHGRQEIHFMPISGQLNPIGETARNVIKEGLGGLGIAVPDHPTQDQLTIGIDCYERPGVTGEATGRNRGRDVLFLRSDKRPKFIDLNPLGLEIYQCAVQVVRASRAKFKRELLNRVFGASGHTGRGAYRISFKEGGYDLCPLGVV